MPCTSVFLTRNEQGSGSSPLVGSPRFSLGEGMITPAGILRKVGQGRDGDLQGLRTGGEPSCLPTHNHTAGKCGWEPQAKPCCCPAQHLRGGTARPSPQTGNRRRCTQRPLSHTSSIARLPSLTSSSPPDPVLSRDPACGPLAPFAPSNPAPSPPAAASGKPHFSPQGSVHYPRRSPSG